MTSQKLFRLSLIHVKCNSLHLKHLIIFPAAGIRQEQKIYIASMQLTPPTSQSTLTVENMERTVS